MTVKIPLAGVAGRPIGHSKSPALFRHWLERYEIDGHYMPLAIAPEDFAEAVKMLPKMGFVGLNVTLPHKEAALTLANKVTDRATMIGAANTLIFRDNGEILADNTDGFGFIANLKAGAPDWEPKRGPAVVLGAGGAARAIVASLLEIGVPELLLTNRTRGKADTLRRDFGSRITVVDWIEAGSAIEDATTVVNTTSLGMVGQPELRVPLDGLRAGDVVTDVVYAPLETTLLKTARRQGCHAVDGLGMLLHQAVPGFERWFGTRPEVTEATRLAVL